MMENIKKVLIISSDKALREVLNFCFDGWGYEVFLLDHLSSDILPIKRISPNIIIIDLHSAGKSHIEVCRLIKDDFLTALIPIITLINKRQLRSQLLNVKQGVDDYLIKPPDPLDLRMRVEMAIKRSQYSYYTTPLTGLPSARIIEEIIAEKLKKHDHFSFCYLDIDNFKYFNDLYGYLKGDRVIMQTAYLLYTVTKKYGNPDDFIGHIGGDDFVFITTPDRYKAICQGIISMFDKIVHFHYSEEDRKRGFVIARDRTHKIKKIPLMDISIAIVNRKNNIDFKNMIQINEKVVEIKQYLKSINGSKFMADRRNIKNEDLSIPQIYKKDILGQDDYKPIGQIFLKKSIISQEQLDEALKIHWKKGIILGEVLKEMDLINDADLQEALKLQKGHSLDSVSDSDFIKKQK